MHKLKTIFKFESALPVNLEENALDISWVRAKRDAVRAFKEKVVVPKTSSYMPTLPEKHCLDINRLFEAAPEFTNSGLSYLKRKPIFTDNPKHTARLERHDPLKGNSLAVIDDYWKDHIIALFSGGLTLSNLIITTSRKKPFKTEDTAGGQTIHLPFDTYKAVKCIDLQYPIRQIAMSPFTNLGYRLFVVRTTSTLHVFKLFKVRNKEDKKITVTVREIYYMKLAERTDTHNKAIDYSQPVYVEMSPFKPYQFLFTTNNGYTALMDSETHTVIYEWKMDLSELLQNTDKRIKETDTYTANWTICTFGQDQTRFFAATHEDVTEWAATGSGSTVTWRRSFFKMKFPEDWGSKKPPIKHDHVTALATCRQSTTGIPLLCFTTCRLLVVMDVENPLKPIMVVPHKMAGAASTLIFEKVDEERHNFRITVFSHNTQRLSLFNFYYNSAFNQLDAVPKFQHNGSYHCRLSKLIIRDMYKATPPQIGCVGLALLSSKYEQKIDDHVGSGSNIPEQFLSVYRLFEDGSLRVKYFDFRKRNEWELEEPDREKVDLAMYPRRLLLKGNRGGAVLKAMFDDTKDELLPETDGRLFTEVELMDLELNQVYKDMLKHYKVYKSRTTVTRQQKADIIAKLKKLKGVQTFRDLTDSIFQRASLDSLLNLLEQLEKEENAQISIVEPKTLLDKPVGLEPEEKNSDLTSYETYKKEMICASIFVRRGEPENEPELTTDTARFFAQEWQLDDTSFHEIPFPDVEYVEPPSKKRTMEFSPDISNPNIQRPLKRNRTTTSLPVIRVEEHVEEVQQLPSVATVAPKVPSVRTPVASAHVVETVNHLKPSDTPLATKPSSSKSVNTSNKSGPAKKKKKKVSGFK